jgi:hypothetical protein
MPRSMLDVYDTLMYNTSMQKGGTMSYQNGTRTITLTRDGRAVTWIVSFEHKTVEVVVAGATLGTWSNRQDARDELDLVEVVVAAKRGA